MLFAQAMEALNEGKYVTRAAWNGTGEYVVLMPGMQNLWKILTVPNPNAGMFNPLVADLNADDWMEYDRVKAVQAVETAEAA